MTRELLPNFAKAWLFHALLLTVAFGTVAESTFGELMGWEKAASGICSIAYYILIPIATQFPHLLFVNSNLRTEALPRPIGRLQFFGGVFVFWVLMGFVLSLQLVWGGDSDLVRRGMARWALLVGLAVFFSALDYAIPSYRRHVRLCQCYQWGPRARVFTKR
ncbi:hypothetical protein [Acidovorax sp.]|uniref:hypothetical protein n=1 Tax=Acidovorax sp. TaxID=1872122 RepID=UPI00391F37E4